MRAAAIFVALAACAAEPGGADLTATGAGTAPMPPGSGAMVSIDGQGLEVRRTRARIPFGVPEVAGRPAALRGEFPDGDPAIAVDGLTRGPGAYELAYAAILTACGIDPQEADREWERFGILGDIAVWSPVNPGTLLIPMRYCPTFDAG